MLVKRGHQRKISPAVRSQRRAQNLRCIMQIGGRIFTKGTLAQFELHVGNIMVGQLRLQPCSNSTFRNFTLLFFVF